MDRTRCPNCTTVIPASATFCPRCGTALRPTAVRAVAPPPPLRSQARSAIGLLAIVFGSLIGFSLLMSLVFTVRTKVAVSHEPARPAVVPQFNLSPAIPPRPSFPSPAPPAVPGKYPLSQPRYYRLAEFDEPELPNGQVILRFPRT